MEDAKEKIKELVERFHLNLDAYKSIMLTKKFWCYGENEIKIG